MKKERTPYLAHIFVCINDRHGSRPSCADHNSEEFKKELKKFINDSGWKGKVRVSTSGCLGLCGNGPNVIIYPQGILFSQVKYDDLNEIKKCIESIVNS
ncbi:MAG: (2Fe-2S) ferredoxin domain-containing protein, partial [Bacteroidetes bacterium]